MSIVYALPKLSTSRTINHWRPLGDRCTSRTARRALRVAVRVVLACALISALVTRAIRCHVTDSVADVKLLDEMQVHPC